MLGLCYWVGVNKKVLTTGEPMPNFFLGMDLIAFLAFLFSKFKPPPSRSQGLCCFFLNIGLTQTCIAIAVPPPPPHGNLTKAPSGRQGNAKLIARNKVFECLTLLKIETIEYGKMGFKMA